MFKLTNSASASPPPKLPAGGPDSDLSDDQILRLERGRMVRERWMHLLLFGFALSIIIHVVTMLGLWMKKDEPRVYIESAPEAVEMKLEELPPPVDVLTEDLDLPDPSTLAAGPPSTELDPIPNLSSEQASGNPNEDSYGMPETPGIGAIVGPGGPGGGIGIGSGKGGGGTSFFGVGGRGTRFAYIVDVSGSMDQENRMHTALAELKRSIGQLPDSTSYYVALFSNTVILPDWDTNNWIRATRSNIARTRDWIDTMAPSGGTYPRDAFERVFKLPRPPDVIFFLTDGEIPGDTAYHIARMAGETKGETIINTIGFSSEAGKEPLIDIAKANRGVFRFVPTQGVGSGAVQP